jgi:dephospho-CoA kinase
MKQNKNNEYRVIGITGGMGCGKSTVSKILEDYGAEVIDSDKIGREVLENSTTVVELIENFGLDIEENGKICKKTLSEIVFKDKQKLELLNSIMHKKIAYEVGEIIKNSKKNDKHDKIFVLDLPLPVKEGFIDRCQEVWVIVSSMENRIQRILLRDNLSYEQIISRINSQMTMDEYIKFGDRIIYNNSDENSLKELVKKAWEEFNKEEG